MTNRKSMHAGCLVLLALLKLTTATSVFANLNHQSIDTQIEKLERGITQASELYDTGELTDATPYLVKIAKNLTLTFSKSSFETDLSLAFGQYEKLLLEKDTSLSTQSLPATTPVKVHTPPVSRKVEVEDDIIALMRAEQGTQSAQSGSLGNNFAATGGFDVYNNYSMSHATKLQQADQMAELDMQNINAERQAVEAERLQEMQRDQELQGQAMEWQAQLDKQASDSARKAAEWEATHSFGAYATAFLGTVVQTTIGSFTGGLLTPVATTLANKAVVNLFGIDPQDIDDYNDQYNSE